LPTLFIRIGISYPLSLYEGPLLKQPSDAIANPQLGDRPYLIQSQ